MNMIIDSNHPYFDWPDWIQFHSTFYGWDGERELKMLLAWSTYFAGEGYGPEELILGTNHEDHYRFKRSLFRLARLDSVSFHFLWLGSGKGIKDAFSLVELFCK